MIRECHYVLMDPTGNRTLLVDTPVPVEEQPSVAAKLMEQEPTAEQTGFLTFSDSSGLSLRMAGGEFCGNATMSAAVYHSIRTGTADDRMTVNVSGAPDLMEAGKVQWRCRVLFPWKPFAFPMAKSCRW